MITVQPDIMFSLLGLSFCSRRGAVKLLRQWAEKTHDFFPPHSFFSKSEKPKGQMSSAHTGRSLLFVWLLKKKKEGGEVFLVSSVHDYNTHMHKLTQAGHRQDRLAQSDMDRVWSRPPPAVGAAPSTHFGCTRLKH